MAIPEEELVAVVSAALDEFYRRRISKPSTLELRQTLRRKNPYLFHAIGAEDASEIVEMILSAYMSSSDEGIFGDAFFEPVAKAVSGGSLRRAKAWTLPSRRRSSTRPSPSSPARPSSTPKVGAAKIRISNR